VTLFEASDEIGGQFNLAKRIPGKEEFHETLRYFARMIDVQGIDLRLNTRVDADALVAGGFDHVVVATGVTPRAPAIEGIDHPKVVSYIDAILGRAEIGEKVAVIGAGGIGFDVCELISHTGVSGALDVGVFAAEWGVDFANHPRGGVTGVEPRVTPSPRQITMLQRKDSKVGAGLGKTTGWTHRMMLGRRGIAMMNAVDYQRIDDSGLHILQDNQPRCLEVDTVIICAGQESLRDLYDAVRARGVSAELIGGAFEAAELDAKAAIYQASHSAAAI
jgi:2,4-dienoyl-CoA reductase (NADPH2)